MLKCTFNHQDTGFNFIFPKNQSDKSLVKLTISMSRSCQ